MAQANLIALVVVIMTGSGSRSGYIQQMILVFYLFSIVVLTAIKAKETYWVFLYGLFQIIPTMYVLYVFNILLQSMLPGIVRKYDGSLSNPEINVILFVCGCMFFASAFYVSSSNHFNQSLIFSCCSDTSDSHVQAPHVDSNNFCCNFLCLLDHGLHSDWLSLPLQRRYSTIPSLGESHVIFLSPRDSLID